MDINATIINKLMTEEGGASWLSAKTLCGPFDQQFRRKFLGHRSTSLLGQRNQLLRSPAFLPAASCDLLPKIREIQKIAKSGGRRKVRRGKEGEVISELELYLTKKLASNQSTKELITRIEATTLKQSDWFRHNEPVRKYSQTSSKFYFDEAAAGKTAYSQRKKWITDQQFREKFDKFVVKRHDEEETVKLNDLFGIAEVESADQIRGKIESDRGALKEIIKKMIESHNYESQMEEEPALGIPSELSDGVRGKERRGIRWIIEKCQDLQQSKNTKKQRKTNKKA